MSPTRTWLVLDFDGVVCDALSECAALTRAAAGPGPGLPTLDEAIAALTPQLLARFASVRPYCRTLADFMVTNAVTAAVTSREEFEAAKAAAGPELLDAQAAHAQQIRDAWRADEPEAWLDMHIPYAGVPDLIRGAGGPVAIVSNKDGESIDAILTHLGLRGDVAIIAGACADKPAAVARLIGEHASASFIDDNLANVFAVAAVPRVRSLWATWGYHSREDITQALTAGVPTLALGELAAVA
ncbi:MAG: HAD family hydrolase [Tetrasphaera sp.]